MKLDFRICGLCGKVEEHPFGCFTLVENIYEERIDGKKYFNYSYPTRKTKLNLKLCKKCFKKLENMYNFEDKIKEMIQLKVRSLYLENNKNKMLLEEFDKNE